MRTWLIETTSLSLPMLNNIVHPIDVDISFLDNKPYMISEATVVYFGVNINILNNVFDFFELLLFLFLCFFLSDDSLIIWRKYCSCARKLITLC